MKDRTILDRTKRHRQRRVGEGWQKVTVWVPTEADAKEIREIAIKRRAEAEALHGLSKEVKTVTPETETRIARAIADHGSAAYKSPSGAVLDLLTELTEEDDLIGFSTAVVILARAKPANANFVAEAVPAKISNFLIRHRGLTASALVGWTRKHPGWRKDLISAVRQPAQFKLTVEAMAESVKAEAAAGQGR
ncbi:hypothetical protein [Mesorhizobium sp. M0589]|uniref:hypothetical protein n=1 Tax=Mesorhizobium sp. M0589 TaxID=2956965 RepID=UPI0033369973